MNETGSTEAQEQPSLRVVRGQPDEHEIAAVSAVLAGLTARGGEQQEAETARSRSRWADPAARLRQPLRPGPGAWRASALPG